MKKSFPQCPFRDYHIIKTLGEGSYGTVYEIQRTVNDTSILSAMKVIGIPSSDKEVEDGIRLGRYTRERATKYYRNIEADMLSEIKLMSQLRGNTHIVSYEDHRLERRTDGIGADLYIRMEYLKPLTLWMREKERTCRDVLVLGRHLCDALSLCARKSIVHGDIKPDNVLVNEMGEFKLGDFGIARLINKNVLSEQRLGSLNYMAPEVLRGEAATNLTDLYSVGMLLYRLTNENRIPFYQLGEEMARERRSMGEPLPAPLHAPEALWNVIRKATEYSPAERYTNAAEMQDALTELLDLPEMETGLMIDCLPAMMQENQTQSPNIKNTDATPGRTSEVRSSKDDTPGRTIGGTGRTHKQDEVPDPILPPKKQSKHQISTGWIVAIIAAVIALAVGVLWLTGIIRFGKTIVTSDAIVQGTVLYDNQAFKLSYAQVYQGKRDVIQQAKDYAISKLINMGKVKPSVDHVLKMRNAPIQAQELEWFLHLRTDPGNKPQYAQDIRLLFITKDNSVFEISEELIGLNEGRGYFYFSLDELLGKAYESAEGIAEGEVLLAVYVGNAFATEIKLDVVYTN